MQPPEESQHTGQCGSAMLRNEREPAAATFDCICNYSALKKPPESEKL